jgi:hypothetical protein
MKTSGRTPWMADQTVARPIYVLHTQDNIWKVPVTYNKNIAYAGI